MFVFHSKNSIAIQVREFLHKTFLPLVNRMGSKIELTLERFGFYPAGGGELRAEIQTAACLKAFDIIERGEFTRSSVTARVAGLSLSIAEREMDVIRRGLDWDECSSSRNLRCQLPLSVVGNGFAGRRSGSAARPC